MNGPGVNTNDNLAEFARELASKHKVNVPWEELDIRLGHIKREIARYKQLKRPVGLEQIHFGEDDLWLTVRESIVPRHPVLPTKS